MKGTWLKRILVLAACVSIPSHLVLSGRSRNPGTIIDADFAQLYYSARCAMHHHDLYSAGAPLGEMRAEAGKLSPAGAADARAVRTVMSLPIYPPTAYFLLAPLALLPYAEADAVWFWLTASLLVAGALMMWDLAEDAPILGGGLAGFMLLACLAVLLSLNPAGIVIPLCVIAAWCQVRRRLELLGMLLMALALVIKPHDAGFVWLYFLLAGGTGRKRALQTLAVAAILGVCAVVWIAPFSPHWIAELHSNVKALSAPGGIADPGPSGLAYRGFGALVSLQGAISLVSNDPRFYGPVSYWIGGGLILAWALTVFRRRASRVGGKDALLALAAISILTLLPMYHRTQDAKLLMLTVPACAMLWAKKGMRRWIAFGLTAVAMFATSDIPFMFLARAAGTAQAVPSTLHGKATLLALLPAPLALLAAGCFYLWVYIRYEPQEDRTREAVALEARAAAS